MSVPSPGLFAASPNSVTIGLPASAVIVKLVVPGALAVNSRRLPCELTVILSFNTCTPPTRALLIASCTALTTSMMLRSGAVSALVRFTVTGLPPFTVFMLTVNEASPDNRPTRPETSLVVRMRSTPSTVAATWLALKPI